MNPALARDYFHDMGVAAPAPGTARVTNTPDDERSIRFELDQMREYVLGAPSDPEFLDVARDVIVGAIGHLPDANMHGGVRYKLAQVLAWFEWVKMNFTYHEDPLSYCCSGANCHQTVKEVIQTPGRMARKSRRPVDLVSAILGPLAGKRIQSSGGDVAIAIPNQALSRISGDCDEAATLVAAGPPVMQIETCFRLGGHIDQETGQPNYHHVWACAFIPGLNSPHSGTYWWDLNATVPGFQAGQFAPFQVYAKFPIYRTREEM